MKKLLIYIFLSSLVGCNEPEEWIGNGSGYSKYLVQNYVDGSYVLYGMLAEKPSTLYSMSGFQVLLEDPVYYQTPEQEGAAYRRFSSNRRAQSRYGIQQSEVASMVGFDRIRRQFHRHKSYQRQRLERQIPGRIAVER